MIIIVFLNMLMKISLRVTKYFFIIAGIDRILTGNSSTRSESSPPTPNIKPLDLSGLEVPEGLYIIEISTYIKYLTFTSFI